MTNFLSPASEALDDASLHSGVVVGLKAEIVVGMCLLSEHRSENGGTLFSTRTSRKASLLSDSSSIVNWMEGCWLLRWSWNSLRWWSFLQEGKFVVRLLSPSSLPSRAPCQRTKPLRHRNMEQA